MTERKLPQLYSLTAIGVATFLGSALAAGYMLASNYSALGQRRIGVYTLWGSVLVVLAFALLPPSFAVNPTVAIAAMVGQVILVLAVANKLQGAMFTSFEEMGGEYFPMTRAVLIGVGASLVLLVALSLVIGALTAAGWQPQQSGA